MQLSTESSPILRNVNREDRTELYLIAECTRQNSITSTSTGFSSRLRASQLSLLSLLIQNGLSTRCGEEHPQNHDGRGQQNEEADKRDDYCVVCVSGWNRQPLS